ncbi:tetratricopeptide repeat protein [Leptospira gomenensis]|uniref:Tetratricopeptide repeat protein n=1 Tax=Leptospira gomenensis TaxID=2484974 RepID=A0A5F1YKD1_9LEPT|nr:tetratricopeptide repeat protein [Leptospira gomenensis]TGK38205.1 tetratricopeptide repeat protein [Leptospira gomenensis]TGK38431.1 tetratricopeptide repeat protein [Leptospira gomenensis]TGK52245.1 tetratricopeptide repeat protein [Leptospira gomenensis]TGK55768.1 tetratricopeptide repeat protein [Leptospira gomenensis]
MKTALPVLINVVSILLFVVNNGEVYPEEPPTTGSAEGYERGERFLSVGRFAKAEKIAESLLNVEPSDPKAEFLLTRAWIGIAREEKKKGNLERAKRYFRKAYHKWPFNQELKSELGDIDKEIEPKKIKRPSIDRRANPDPNQAQYPDPEFHSTISDTEKEVKPALLRTKTNDREGQTETSKEGMYRTALSLLAGVSILNLILTILLWRKK